MNVGQILEIHLGRAAKGLGDQVNAMIEGNKVDELRKKLKQYLPNHRRPKRLTASAMTLS